MYQNNVDSSLHDDFYVFAVVFGVYRIHFTIGHIVLILLISIKEKKSILTLSVSL